MSYKIVVDSCGELTEKMKKDSRYESIPLCLQVDDATIIDDENFDQLDFIRRVAMSPNCPKSSCPSPEKYMEAFDCDADHVYAVTLSSELSGSYNSAQLGRNLYLEEKGKKDIYVFNSRSASIGQTLIAKRIAECEENGMSFEEVIEAVERYIEGQHTYFVLENLDTLRKNGRLSNVKAFVASALKIKPVMCSTPAGTIQQLDQARGMNKALLKMVEYVTEQTEDKENKTLAISHCNCPERAQMVKEELQKRGSYRDIILLDTAGVSTMYANDGGIIIAV